MQMYDIIYNKGEMMYTKEERAIKFVIKALEGKKRIKKDIVLSFHSISVGIMLKNNNCDENTVLAGFLHDIIEDACIINGAKVLKPNKFERASYRAKKNIKVIIDKIKLLSI